MNVFLRGGEILTSEGNLEATWSAIMSGSTPGQITPAGHNQSYPLAVIPELGPAFGTAKRLDNLLTKLFDTLPQISPDTELICATTKGAIDEIIHQRRSVHSVSGQTWQVNEEIQRHLDLDRRGDCISAACASGTIAIAQGAMKILAGECRHTLIVGFDILSDFVLAGFSSLKALAPSACRPFDKNRDGLSLGEGAGWLLLSRDPGPFLPYNITVALTGIGISCDATHITAPCRKASGLIRALRQTMAGKDMAPGGINAHGTGTHYNDAMELLAFQTVWTHPPPLCSVKGTIGHCLGGAGIIESCLSIKSLERNMLPPTAGLLSPEDKAEPYISGTTALPLQNPSILTCNSGFGGINAALLFEKVQ